MTCGNTGNFYINVVYFNLQMLTLPQDMVRSFRDDITVVVPFFDSEFLGKN